MRAFLKVDEGIVLSPWKTRQIKGAMEIQYSKMVDELKSSEKPEKVYSVKVGSPPVRKSKEGDQAGE